MQKDMLNLNLTVLNLSYVNLFCSYEYKVDTNMLKFEIIVETCS